MGLAERTEKFITRQGLTRPGDLLLLAVSGGVDSMCLAHILLALRDKLRIDLAIAHFDHQLREESAEEAEFVADFARSRELPFIGGGADIRALGGNIEATARRERYAFLRLVAEKLGADSIAVAHHADDQAETLLLHLLRGSGSTGLAAMSPRSQGLIRPLLFARRREIEEYAAAHDIPYREDASNADTRYLRNRLRHQLLPVLAEYNPHIVEALNATADICRAEDELLNDMAENSLAELWLEDDCVLDKEGFDRLPVALRRRVARKAFTLIEGERRELDHEQTEAILRLRDEAVAELPGGLKAYLRGNICFAWQVPPLPCHEQELPLVIDGRFHPLADCGWEYQAAPTRLNSSIQPLACVLPEELLEGAIFRTRRPGDQLRSAGEQGQKKLKDVFIREHIPAHQRADWPILCKAREILWAPGLWRLPEAQGEKRILIKLRKCDKIKH